MEERAQHLSQFWRRPDAAFSTDRARRKPERAASVVCRAPVYVIGLGTLPLRLDHRIRAAQRV